MTTTVSIDYRVLATALREQIIPIYQDKSILSLFPSEPIPEGIAADKWAARYLEKTQRAAWSRAGFQPNTIIGSFEGFSLEIDTVAQRMELSEKDMAFYETHGFFQPFVNLLGENVAWTTNKAFMMGYDEVDGNPHSGQYNYLIDEGSSPGTAVRPMMPAGANNNSAGAWSTFANAQTDLTLLIGGLAAVGYNPATTYVLYPEVVEPLMMRALSEYNVGHSIKDYIGTICAGAIKVGDDFLQTASRSTMPTTADFDIVAVDVSQVVIGYAREERIRVVPPFGTTRATTVEGEVWYCPLFIPKPRVSNATTYYLKGVGMVDGCS
jgi:hypothetical protein